MKEDEERFIVVPVHLIRLLRSNVLSFISIIPSRPSGTIQFWFGSLGSLTV